MKTNKGLSTRKHKIIIDWILGALLVVQVLFQFTPRIVHCVAGIALVILLVIHIWQHRTWFKALNRGKWNRKRIVKTISVVLVVAFLVTTIVLGFSIPDSPGGYNGYHGGQGGHGGFGNHNDFGTHSVGGHHGSGPDLLGNRAQPHHFLGYVTAAVCLFHVAVNVHFKNKRPAK